MRKSVKIAFVASHLFVVAAVAQARDLTGTYQAYQGLYRGDAPRAFYSGSHIPPRFAPRPSPVAPEHVGPDFDVVGGG
jgi:hypothetical protein